MTHYLTPLKQLYVDNHELKKLYANDKLIWRKEIAWKKKLDMNPSVVKIDEYGFVYVLLGKYERILKLTKEGFLVASFNTGISAMTILEKNLLVANGKIYVYTYPDLYIFNSENGDKVQTISLDTYVSAIDYNDNFIVRYTNERSGCVIYNENFELIKSEYNSRVFVDSKVLDNGNWYGLDVTSQSILKIDKEYKISKSLTIPTLSGYYCGFDFYENNYYILTTERLAKIAEDGTILWSINVDNSNVNNSYQLGFYPGSIIVEKCKIIVRMTSGLFVYGTSEGELLYYKKGKESLWNSGSSAQNAKYLLSKSDNGFFYNLAYDEKAVYKLELGDEDNYENLN